MKKAFTLIELLVVVLIIGILAAVALPQYQRAVDKSRFAALLPLVRAVANAKSEYYLANGEHARTFDVLSITLPPEFEIKDDADYGQKAIGTKREIFLDASEHRVIGRLFLSDGSTVFYYMPISEVNSTVRCSAASDKRGTAFCKSIPGAKYLRTESGFVWYAIN